ncbi:MAG TPA: hypothetical protein DEP72_00870 [Clostridiales bacterium]|nr:MAG: hypothetical protein A2Y18_04965 [Clostridiales bacterium GWD2_32_19]HCC06705.1 hypothetical protein [Clostridiales bacterium]
MHNHYKILYTNIDMRGMSWYNNLTKQSSTNNKKTVALTTVFSCVHFLIARIISNTATKRSNSLIIAKFTPTPPFLYGGFFII